MTSRAPGADTNPPNLRTRALLLAAVGLLLCVAAATVLQDRFAQDLDYPLRAAAVFTLVMAMALGGLRGGHPFAQIGPANLVTGGRAAMMALLAGVALGPQTPASGWWLVLVATLGASADALDGPAARRSGLASRFGARFDMEVDALLILVLSVLVWRVVPLGAWVLASGLMRYAFVAAGWWRPWLTADLPPSRRRQAVCVVQIVALIAALAPIITATMAAIITAGALALLVWSFAVDVRWLSAHR